MALTVVSRRIVSRSSFVVAGEWYVVLFVVGDSWHHRGVVGRRFVVDV
ncbi:hypothetical protein ACXZ9C_10475 [Streptococcus agalactiae]